MKRWLSPTVVRSRSATRNQAGWSFHKGRVNLTVMQVGEIGRGEVMRSSAATSSPNDISGKGAAVTLTPSAARGSMIFPQLIRLPRRHARAQCSHRSRTSLFSSQRDQCTGSRFRWIGAESAPISRSRIHIRIRRAGSILVGLAD